MPSRRSPDDAAEHHAASAPAWHTLAIDDALAQAGSRPEGLTEDEVVSRQQKHGANELAAIAGISTWRLLAAQFSSLIVWILIGAALVSGVVGEWVDAIAIMAIVVINGIIGFYQEYNAERSITALRRMTAPQAKVRRGGNVGQVPSREVVPGDILLFEAGDIKADIHHYQSVPHTAAEIERMRTIGKHSLDGRKVMKHRVDEARLERLLAERG